MKKLLALSILGCIPLALAGCGVTSSPPPPPAVATGLSVSPSSAPPTAGTPFSFTVSAVDANGGLVPSYSGTVHVTSSDLQAVLPPDAALTSGTGTFQVTFKTAGVQTISANDPAKSLASGTSNPINVSPGATTKLTVSSPSPVTSGFSISVTVTAYDAFGNQATNYAGTVHLTSSDAQAVLPPDSTLVNGSQVFSPVTLKTIAAQTVITATDTVTVSIKGVSNSISVVSNATTHLSMSSPASADTRATFSVTVKALDAANNVSTGYAGTVHFTSSDSSARLPADSTLTSGMANFSVTLESVGNGTQTVIATDVANSSFTATSSLSVSAPPLAISSAAPPNGKVGTVYGEVQTLYFRCVYNFFTRRVVCTPCTPGLGGTCGSLPPCGIRYPCIEITHPFVGFKFAGTGGVPPYNTWTVAGLPPGLTVNPSNGEVLGTPTSLGTFPLTVTMTDSGLPTATLNPPASFTLTINLPDIPVVNTTPPPPPGVLGQLYSYTFTAKGYGPFTFNESGALPGGLTFSSGLLSGTPTQTGSFPITVTATDQFKQTSNPPQPFTIVVTAHGFVATDSMATARRFHTATLLPNGKVLVAGGQNAFYTAVVLAELYDPSSGTFSATGNMTVARAGHTATLLNNGKVLIAGGNSGTSGAAAAASAELYDPSTGTFTATPGSMTAARVSHTATLLQSGKVLIAGGDVNFYSASGQSLASAETFDPSTGTFTATGSMTVPRESHTATLLSSGKVLITGGSDGTLGYTPITTLYASSETFDPSTGQFTAAGMMTTQRDWQTASLLASGKVLVAGGKSTSQTDATADLFDPSTGSFAATGNMTEPRFYHAASTLNDGTVLISGGSDNVTGAKATAEIYDPTAGTSAATGSMNTVRVWHTSTVLQSGKVLITGGSGNGGVPMATAEVYQ